ncbi:MAG: TraB/GumN family protein [Pseudomonadales bacterium]
MIAGLAKGFCRRALAAWPTFAILLAIASGATGAPGAVATDTAWARLPGAKAEAIDPGNPRQRTTVVQGQANDLAAALGALQQCQALQPEGPPCELTRLNDERIATGRQIRARVPTGPHPLFLWRYERGATTLYLAGSIHILKPSLYPVAEQLETAFAQSDQLVLEVNTEQYPQDELTRRSLAHGRLPEGAELQTVLPAPIYQRLAQRLADYGVPMQNLAPLSPAMVMNQFVVYRLMSLGYLPEYGLEQHFMAQRGARPILELESLEAQLTLLFDQPLPVQIQLLADTLDLEAAIEPMLADMVAAWLSGDDARFLTLFEEQSGDSAAARAFNRALLDDRNVGMAARISELLTRPGKYFVLIGAAHLVGDQGIVALLERQGVRGRRIYSTDRL